MSSTKKNVLSLRGTQPRIDADASNIDVVVNKSDHSINKASFAFYNGSNLIYLLSSFSNDGIIHSATDMVETELKPPQSIPYMSFRTTMDREEMRIDSTGLSCSSINASRYMQLSSDYTSANVFKPPNEYALADSFITLSNLITTRTAVPESNLIIDKLYLQNTFLSTSVLEAPTANALRGAYISLSNQMAINYLTIQEYIGYSPQSTYHGSSNEDVLSTRFPNDYWILSIQDTLPRFRFEHDSETVIASCPSPTTGVSFRFFDNMLQHDLTTIDSNGTIKTIGDIDIGNNAQVTSNINMGGDLILGGHVRITHKHSNIGVNLPIGADPEYTFHVNGSLFSTQQIFALSDRRVKSDIQPIKDPLKIVDQIRGYTFTMQEKRCIGVIAQDVQNVVPEAVCIHRNDPNGKLLAVSYDSLVGVLFEAVREISKEIQILKGMKCKDSMGDNNNVS